jgi:hypothetical protein
MTTEERAQMNSLCTQIQNEKEYAKFVMLLRELDILIEQKGVRFGHRPFQRDWRSNKPSRTVPAVVRKVLNSVGPGHPEKVEISIETADELFREIRIDNVLTTADGQTVALQNSARVDVTFEAELEDTIQEAPKPGLS